MNELERWAADGLIELLTSQVAQDKMLVGEDALRRAKAYRFIFTMSEITSQQERDILRNVEVILFPEGANTANQRNDVEIVFNAARD